MTIAQLKEQRKKALDDAKAIVTGAGDNPLTKEQNEQIDTLTAKAEELRQDIERREKLEVALATLTEPEERKTDSVQPTRELIHAEAKEPEPWNELRFGSLRAFPNDKEGRKAAYQSGQWIRGFMFGNRSAQEWCKRNMPEIRALSENANTAGGYLVPTVLAQAIIDLREVYGVARQVCDVMPMSSDTLSINRRTGGVTISSIAESAAMSSTDPTWDQVGLVAKKWGGYTLIPNELVEDAVISVADWVAREFAYGFAKKEDECLFLGDGSTTYQGISGVKQRLGATIGAGQLAGAVDAASNHDTFAEIDNADLATLIGKCPAYALPNAAFYCSAACKAIVFDRLQATAGGVTPQQLGGRMVPSYQGYPIIISQAITSSTGDLSDLPMLYFGDMRLAATMGVRRDVRMITDTSRFVEYDQTAVLATERFDINVHDYGDTSTAGPILALIGE